MAHEKALALLCVLLMFAAIASLSIGAVSLTFHDIFLSTLSDEQQAVLFSIRLPRVLLAGFVGAALAVSGAAMQGLFRNPLADPGLIGITAGSAFAVALMIVFGASFGGLMGVYGLSIAAFCGGVFTCLVVFRLSKTTGSFSVTYMLLAGIAINALAGAGTSFLAYISDDQQLRALTFWTMGNVGGALWPAVFVSASVIVPCVFYLMRKAAQLNILLLGEEEAQHLGVDSERLKRSVVIATALCVGAAVAVSGIIGFIGLVVPHLVRLLIGPDNKVLIPASALMGALLLMVADTIARSVFAPAEMPVGILTSLIGGPFFLWLLIKQYSGRFGT